MHIAQRSDSVEERNLALAGIHAVRRWRIVPINLMPVGHGIVVRVAERLCGRDLLPPQEVNGSLLLAEAALLGARLLRSGDEHSRGVDFSRLCVEL